jgi:hypothetical protein
MDILKNLQGINPEIFPIIILSMSFLFAIAWFYDSKFHGKIYETDITDKELQTHRLILIPSVLMEITLILMYWLPFAMLPFFMAFYLVRTVQEFIDELHFHTDRCTFFESILHLIMWITVHTKTFAFFIWAFILRFKGIEELPFVYFAIFLLLTAAMGLIGLVEWNRKVK